MDKAFLLYVMVGLGFFYVITHYVGEIQKEDEVIGKSVYAKEHKYDNSFGTDNVGRVVFDLPNANLSTQMKVWNETSFKEELLALFPSFEEMKVFIEDRVQSEALREKLLLQLAKAEDGFLSGTMNGKEVKASLSTLKGTADNR